MGDHVTALEIKVRDMFRAPENADEIVVALGGFPYRTNDWINLNANLFSWMQTEKRVMFRLADADHLDRRLQYRLRPDHDGQGEAPRDRHPQSRWGQRRGPSASVRHRRGCDRRRRDDPRELPRVAPLLASRALQVHQSCRATSTSSIRCRSVWRLETSWRSRRPCWRSACWRPFCRPGGHPDSTRSRQSGMSD